METGAMLIASECYCKKKKRRRKREENKKEEAEEEAEGSAISFWIQQLPMEVQSQDCRSAFLDLQTLSANPTEAPNRRMLQRISRIVRVS